MSADTSIFVARRIVTLNPSMPRATHLAVRDGRVLAPGGAEIRDRFPGIVDDRTATGRVLGADERITPNQAPHAVTLGAAYTLKLDHLVGSLDVGKFADCAVLADDPLEVDPLSIKDIAVRATILGGQAFPAS